MSDNNFNRRINLKELFGVVTYIAVAVVLLRIAWTGSTGEALFDFLLFLAGASMVASVVGGALGLVVWGRDRVVVAASFAIIGTLTIGVVLFHGFWFIL